MCDDVHHTMNIQDAALESDEATVSVAADREPDKGEALYASSGGGHSAAKW